MSERFAAEAILRAAASGAIPAPGDALVRTQDGWVFQQVSEVVGGGGGGGGGGSVGFIDLTGVIFPSQVPAAVVNQHIQQKEVELDWGADLFQTEKQFTIVDAGVDATKQISMWHSLATPTGKDADEGEMDTFICRCVAAAGEFTAYINSMFGSVVGPFKFNYLIG